MSTNYGASTEAFGASAGRFIPVPKWLRAQSIGRPFLYGGYEEVTRSSVSDDSSSPDFPICRDNKLRGRIPGNFTDLTWCMYGCKRTLDTFSQSKVNESTVCPRERRMILGEYLVERREKVMSYVRATVLYHAVSCVEKSG